jgi:hypothetical protein
MALVVCVLAGLAALVHAPAARAAGTFEGLTVTVYGTSDRQGVIYDKAYRVKVQWTYRWDAESDRPAGRPTITLFEADPTGDDTIASVTRTFSGRSVVSGGSYVGRVDFTNALATASTVDESEDWNALSICATVVQPTLGSGDLTSPAGSCVVYVQPQNVTGLKTSRYLDGEMSWNRTPGAPEYQIYRSPNGRTGWVPTLLTTETSCPLSRCAPPPAESDVWYFMVKGVNRCGSDDEACWQYSPGPAPVSPMVYGLPATPPMPSYPSIAGRDYLVSWRASRGAMRYYLYEVNVATGQSRRIADTPSTAIIVSIRDKANGSQYQHYLEACNPLGAARGDLSPMVTIRKR